MKTESSNVFFKVHMLGFYAKMPVLEVWRNNIKVLTFTIDYLPHVKYFNGWMF